MKFAIGTGFVTLLGTLCAAQGLQEVQNYGSTKSGARMFVYKPASVVRKPPILVGVHYCGGNAQRYYNGSPYKSLADQKGFVVVYPQASHDCWDVSSKASLVRGGGAESNSIAEMIKYAIAQYNADASKVFVIGESSGGMMTNVLAATYPDLIAAAIDYSGVPAGCFYTGSVAGWNNSCSGGQIQATAAQWAKWVLDAYPGYNGPRPRMQVYHGSADTTLAPINYNWTITQWATVFGYNPAKPVSVTANTPRSGYTTQIFGDHLTGVYAKGVGHGVPVIGAEDMKFFGL